MRAARPATPPTVPPAMAPTWARAGLAVGESVGLVDSVGFGEALPTTGVVGVEVVEDCELEFVVVDEVLVVEEVVEELLVLEVVVVEREEVGVKLMPVYTIWSCRSDGIPE